MRVQFNGGKGTFGLVDSESFSISASILKVQSELFEACFHICQSNAPDTSARLPSSIQSLAR